MKNNLGYFLTIKYLSKYSKKYTKNFVMFSLGWFIDMVLSILIPTIFGIMVDEIAYYQNVSVFMRISLFLLAITLFSCLLCFFICSQHHYLMSMFTYDIKTAVFEHTLKCDSKYLSSMSTGNVVATILTFSNECLYFLVRNVIHFFNGILKLLLLTTCLLLIDWKIGLFSIIAAPLSVFISTRFGKKTKVFGSEQRKQYAGLTSWIFDKLNGLMDIWMLGAKERAGEEFKLKQTEAYKINYSYGIYSMSANNIVKFFNLCVQLSLFVFVGVRAKLGDLTIGYFLVIMSYYNLLTRQIGFTSSSILDSQNRISYIQYLKNYLLSPSEDLGEDKQELNVSYGIISIRNLTFGYEKGKNVLDDLNLDVYAGERLALVGKSGCGKTTLARIIVGLFQKEQGKIWIDNQEIGDCSLQSIRNNLGLVSQDVLIFEGTIKDNVLLGRLNANDEEVYNACKLAGMMSFLDKLPQGIYTTLGKNGLGLSSGQKQRIAIARIYLKNPKIIIFDEATSYLDKDTEKEIHEAWQQVLDNRTSIIIAHRKSSVMLCQRVAILNGGRIIKEGIPSEMIGKSKEFTELFASAEDD